MNGLEGWIQDKTGDDIRHLVNYHGVSVKKKPTLKVLNVSGVDIVDKTDAEKDILVSI